MMLFYCGLTSVNSFPAPDLLNTFNPEVIHKQMSKSEFHKTLHAIIDWISYISCTKHYCFDLDFFSSNLIHFIS